MRATVASVALGLLGLLVFACSEAEAPVSSPLADPEQPAIETAADVIAVEVSGSAGSYGFAVTVSSPDTGCEQYADWWEVVTPEGDLIYRRVLLHSHASEQPFTRSGSPVDIAPEDTVIVRAHMNTGGYGGQARRGAVAMGFEAVDLAPGFAAELASRDPLPAGCYF